MTQNTDPRDGQQPVSPVPVQPAAPAQPVQPADQQVAQPQIQPSAQAAAQAQAQANAQAQAAAAESYRQQVYQAYAQQAQAQHVQTAAGAKSPKPGLGKTFAAGFAGAALAVVLGLGGFVGCSALLADDSSDLSAPQQSAPAGSAIGDITVNGEDATLPEAVAAKVLPSVASIDTYKRQVANHPGMFGYEDRGNDADSSLAPLGLGSGVVIREDGYIVTNYHVIEGADEVHATVGGAEYVAEVVGSDPSSDIAVLKVDAAGLDAVEIGSSSDLVVGQWVMTLGNPFGLENSVSTGIVSAMQRSTAMTGEDGSTVIYPNMIQTDAAINPGNSGGALVDANGRLVGINTLIKSYSGSSSMVGFAIPIDYAMGLVDQIIAGETPSHAQLGVSMATITPEMAVYYGLSADHGVFLANVYEGTAADKAGLKRGDIIVAFDGEPVNDASELMLDVRGHAVGDKVEVTVIRDGAEKTVKVTLGSDTSSTTSGNGYGEGGEGGSGNGGGNGSGWGF